MQQLQEINFQKCIDVIEDFQQAIPSDSFCSSLEAKKRQAQQALEHMRVLLNNRAVGEGDCHTCNGGQQSQNEHTN